MYRYNGQLVDLMQDPEGAGLVWAGNTSDPQSLIDWNQLYRSGQLQQVTPKDLGYDPEDKQFGGDGNVKVKNMSTGQYETANQNFVPLSIAQANGWNTTPLGNDPAWDTGIGQEFLQGPASVLAAPFVPGVSSYLGGLLGSQVAGAAATGALKSGITGGNPILGALTSGATSAAGDYFGAPSAGTSAGNTFDNNGNLLYASGYGGTSDVQPVFDSETGTWADANAAQDAAMGADYLSNGGTIPYGTGSGGEYLPGSDFLKNNPWLAPAIGAGGSVLAGLLGSNATRDAANIQAQAAGAAGDEARREYDQSRADILPFLKTGTAANARLGQLLGVDPTYTGADSGYLTRRFTNDDLNADPVYQNGLQFGLDQGTKAINQRALATGNFDSGATLKALTQYGNDYGTTKANDSYNRFTNDQSNIYSRLTGTSGSGQTATGQAVQAGNTATNAVTNSIDSAANARAAGIVGGSNAWGTALSGVNNAVQGYQNNELLKRILGGSSATY